MEVVDDLKENQEPDSSPSYYQSKRGPNLDSDSENPKSMSEDEQSGSASSPSQQRDSSTRENVEPKLPENAPTEKSSNLHPNSSSTMHSSQQQLLELREFGSIPPDDVASSTVSNRRMGMDADNSFALSSAEGHLPDSNLSLSSSSQPPDGSFGRVIYGVHRASSARPVHKLSVALLTTYKEINRVLDFFLSLHPYFYSFCSVSLCTKLKFWIKLFFVPSVQGCHYPHFISCGKICLSHMIQSSSFFL